MCLPRIYLLTLLACKVKLEHLIRMLVLFSTGSVKNIFFINLTKHYEIYIIKMNKNKIIMFNYEGE